MLLEYKTERIYSLSVLKPGDHIRTVRAAYSHHMLIVEVIDDTHVRLIHFTAINPKIYGMPTPIHVTGLTFSGYKISSGSGWLIPESAVVVEEVLRIDPNEEAIEVVKYGANTRVYSPDEAINRGRSRIGRKDYHIFTNNCESIINWIMMGRSESRQADALSVGLVAVSAVLGLGVLFPLTAAIIEMLLSCDW